MFSSFFHFGLYPTPLISYIAVPHFLLFFASSGLGSVKTQIGMKKFFGTALALLAAAGRTCAEWIDSKMNGPDIYRDGWSRPDPDEVR